MEIPRSGLEQVDLSATLGQIVRNAVQALGGSAGVVAIWSEAEHRFAVAASYGLDSQAVAQLEPLLHEAAPDLAGSEQSFDLLSELLPEVGAPLSDTGVRQDPIIALPLKTGGKSLGLIYVLRPLTASSFSKMDQPVLAAFAEQAAIAVQNARLAYLLAQEKQRVESIIESSADGIVSIDAQRRLVGFNRAMEKLTGYSRQEVLGKECFKVLNVTDREGESLCSTRCPLLTGFANTTLEMEGVIHAKDGQEIDVAMVYAAVRSPEGKPTHAVVNVRDMSRFREIENLRETFLSMLGHELQTPLSIIKGYTSTLARSDSNWDLELSLIHI